MKALFIEQTEGQPGKIYCPLRIKSVPDPTGSVVVQILAAALNHRDLFIRQGLYPGIDANCPLGADGVGINLATKERVLIIPGVGWKEARSAPEGRYLILGGTKGAPGGTLAEKIALSAEQVVPCPDHLNNVQAAALPLAGLTAYRALYTKGQVQKGDKVLITGIGGGVALMAAQLAIAAGADVYVTSGSDEKLKKAKELGVKGSINYKTTDWAKQLKGIVDGQLDVVIDSSGGNIVEMVTPLLKQGGIIVSYGMTTLKPTTITMNSVLKNLEFRTSTMGSAREFDELVQFVAKHKLVPLVEHVFHGLEQADQAFDLMKNADQFGKIVISLEENQQSSKI